MQTLIILWQPNATWAALSDAEQKDYLRSLDTAVNEARSFGVMTLGWSKIDQQISRAVEQGYVGVFAMSDEESIRELDKNIEQSGWYDYFDSVNLSINPQGGTNPQPSEEYARILNMEL